MSALDIPPHPARSSRLALGLLALVALAAFTEGFLRQLAANGPATPPPAAYASNDGIADAKPAPAPILQVAEAPPKPRHVVETETDSGSADASPLVEVPAAQPVAADAAATAPEAAPAPPEPAQDEPPH